MSSQLRGAAKACLVSTLTGLLWMQGGNVLAQSANRVRHADAEEDVDVGEFSPPVFLGRPAPQANGSARPSVDKTAGAAKVAVKPQAQTQAKAQAKSKTMVKAPAERESKEIEQTAALRNRLFPAQPQPAPAAQQPAPVPLAAPPTSAFPAATAPAAAPSVPRTAPPTAVERELEELYRKNGRQMPDDMDLYEFQPPGATPNNGNLPNSGMRPQAGAPSNAGYQPAPKSAKPNFFERIFGVGRAKNNKAPVSNVPAPKGAPQQAGQPAGSPRPALAPFRSQITAQPAGRVPMQEPASLGPSGAMPMPLGQQPVAQTPAPRARDSQPLLDESGSRGDSESLDLADDPVFQPARPTATPQIVPQAPKAKPDSPYTGLTITPNETEQSIASGDNTIETPARTSTAKLPAPFAAPAAEPAVPAATSTITTTAPAPVTTAPAPVATAAPPASAAPAAAPAGRSSLLTNPIADLAAPEPVTAAQAPTIKAPATAAVPAAPPASPAPKTALGNPLAGAKAAPSVARTPPKSDDDESLDLDDEDEDEDEEESTPARTPPGGLKPLPTIEKPAFTRGTIEVSREPVAPKAAPQAPASAAEKPATVTAAKGFKGFCPVILKDERRLVEARAQFKSEYNGRWYSFSSQAAKESFDESPQRYVPAIGGNDVVRQAAGEKGIEGSLEHAAWYRGKLFLFSTAESRREFVDEPAKFTVNE